MNRTSETRPSTTARVIIFSWIAAVAAVVIWLGTSLLISFIRPGIDYEFDSSIKGLEDCFGVNEVVSDQVDAETSVDYPPSAYNTVSTEYRIACSWSLHEDEKRAGDLTMHAIITYRVLDEPNEERVEDERNDESTIIAETLNGFDFGFCYVEAQADPILPPDAIEVNLTEPARACETRDSNFRLWFSTNNPSVDIPEVTEAAGAVLQEVFRR
jgi:hypothetical protein